jgi:virginiamycin B lyase
MRLVAVVVAAAAVASAAAAAPASAVTITSFPAAGDPSAIVSGPDGNLWFAEGTGRRIGRIGPSGAGFTHFPAPPDLLLGDTFGITAGPDGNLWFADQIGRRVGRITQAGAVTEFLVGGAPPLEITTGADGNLWFTDFASSKIGRIAPDGSMVASYPPVGTLSGRPYGITSGPDGNLWFAIQDSRKIGRITPSGTITEFPSSGTLLGNPRSITTGPDGNIWFTDIGAGRVGRIATDGTGLVEFPVPNAGAVLDGITAGPDGNIWYADLDDRIGRVTPAGAVDTFVVGGGAVPTGITAGPDGNLWFTQFGMAAGVGRVTTDVPAPSSGNLLRNPGFEDGLPAVAPAPVPVPGWALMPNATVATYAGLFVPPPAGGGGAGNQLMWGGPYNAQSAVIQQVDVSGQAAGIDAGRGEITLSALLGGGGAEEDDAIVIATFRSATDADLGATAIGPVTAADRGSTTGLLPRGIVAGVPAGTRAIRVEARLVRQLGPTNDGLVDDVSLVLNVAPAPEPPPPPPSPPPPGGGGLPGGRDLAPRATIDVPAKGAARAGKLRKLMGTASDDKGVARVDVAVLKLSGGARAAKRVKPKPACSQLTAAGKFIRVKPKGRRCSPTVFLRAKGTRRWSLKLPAALPAGSFVVYARATDTAGRQATRRLSLTLR